MARARTLTLSLILISLALFSGCGSQHLSPGEARSMPASVVTATAAVQYCADACTSTTSNFSISSVRDINVVVAWRNLPPGPHVQVLSLRTPSGDPYARIQNQLDSTNQVLENGLPTVHSVFPVAGTWIQQRAITGRWTVDVLLDNQLIASSDFSLQ